MEQPSMDSPPRHRGPAQRFRDAGDRLSLLPDNMRGILWMLLAGMLLTVMVTLIKILGERLHVAQIIFIRQVLMTLIVAPTIIYGLPHSLVTRRPMLHALRVVCASTAMLCGFTAAVHLPLADATAIGFSKTFFLTVLAIFFLNETVGRHRWAATLIGFLGVIIIARPAGAEGTYLYSALAVIGACGASVVMVIIRKLSQVERPITILSYQAVFVGVIMAPIAFYNWLTPTWEELGLLVVVGLFSWAGQMCNIRAFRAGEASAIAAFDYMRLIYATVVGFLIFGDIPGIATLAGAALIVTAALYTAFREQRLGRQVTARTGVRSDPP
jgi:drug/metabolite transporter (DMT)-like permease